MIEDNPLAVECLNISSQKIVIRNSSESNEEYLTRIARIAADLHLKYAQFLLQNLNILSKIK